MRSVYVVAVTIFASAGAFLVPAPGSSSTVSAPARTAPLYVFGSFFGGPENNQPSASSGKRLNLKDIKAASAAKKPVAAAKKPVAAAKPAAKSVSAAKPTGPPAARMVNGKLQGYFSEEQLEALRVARATVPSNSPQYWQRIAAQVPGQTPETCKAMAYQLAFDKSAGSKKNFFGGSIEVKETKDYVDVDATPMNRFKQAFGLK